MRNRILVILVLFVSLFLWPVRNLYAQEFRTDYDASYTLPSSPQEDARVRFKITLTNLKADTYVDSYSLTFPSTFEITNVTATDDEGAIDPIVSRTAERYQIELKGNDVQVGRRASTTFVVEFAQKNLFRRTGSVWEVMLPTIGNRNEGSYNVSVQIPPDGQTLSIAKPKPTRNEGGIIEWKNPTERTIYAVFGPKQSYKLALTYDIENPDRIPKPASIALPPDTLYQKLFISSIEPKPDSYYSDVDGNYMAVYKLPPKSLQQVVFKGNVSVFAAPREEVRTSVERAFATQKEHLLSKTDQWSLLPSKTISALKSPKQIHDFVTNTFSYDFARTQQGTDRRRYGAKEAMQSPNKAVCLEYTDTFVAIARTNGIPAREIQGYAFTDNEMFRPVSLVNDVLHSWPEYFEEQSGLWKQIDPTWEDTSGIDYFSSFDLNHVAFAIHGEKSTEPLPAGMYKTVQRKNVSVAPIEEEPKEVLQLAVDGDSFDIKTSIDDSTTQKGSFTILNQGNTYRYEVPVEIRSGGLIVSPERYTIDVIAPGGSAEVSFTYKSRTKGSTVSTDLSGSVGDEQLFTKQITITPASYVITIVLGVIIIGLFGSAVIILRRYVSR